MRRPEGHRPRRQRDPGSRVGFDLPAYRYANSVPHAGRYAEDNAEGDGANIVRSQGRSHGQANPGLAAHRDTDCARDTGASSSFGRTANGRAGNAQCPVGEGRSSAAELGRNRAPKSTPRRPLTAISSATGGWLARLTARCTPLRVEPRSIRRERPGSTACGLGKGSPWLQVFQQDSREAVSLNRGDSNPITCGRISETPGFWWSPLLKAALPASRNRWRCRGGEQIVAVPSTA